MRAIHVSRLTIAGTITTLLITVGMALGSLVVPQQADAQLAPKGSECLLTLIKSDDCVPVVIPTVTITLPVKTITKTLPVKTVILTSVKFVYVTQKPITLPRKVVTEYVKVPVRVSGPVSTQKIYVTSPPVVKTISVVDRQVSTVQVTAPAITKTKKEFKTINRVGPTQKIVQKETIVLTKTQVVTGSIGIIFIICFLLSMIFYAMGFFNGDGGNRKGMKSLLDEVRK